MHSWWNALRAASARRARSGGRLRRAPLRSPRALLLTRQRAKAIPRYHLAQAHGALQLELLGVALDDCVARQSLDRSDDAALFLRCCRALARVAPVGEQSNPANSVGEQGSNNEQEDERAEDRDLSKRGSKTPSRFKDPIAAGGAINRCSVRVATGSR